MEGQASSNSAGEGVSSGENGAVATGESTNNMDANVAIAEKGNEETKPDYRSDFRKKFGEGIEGWDPENNDMFYQEANKQYDSLTKYKSENDAINKKMISTLESNPAAAGLFRDIMKGASLEVAIARNVDVDSLKPLEGEPDFDEWSKAKEERLAKLSEKEKYMAEMDNNVNASIDVIKAFAGENSLDEGTTVKFMDQVSTMVGELVNGKVTPQILKTLYRAFNADNEVKSEVEKAVVDVKNQKIEAIKEQEGSKKGDGLPVLDASNVHKEKETTPEDPWSKAANHSLNKKKL